MVNDEIRSKLYVVVRQAMKEKDRAFQLLPNEGRKVAYDLSLAVLIFTIFMAITGKIAKGRGMACQLR